MEPSRNTPRGMAEPPFPHSPQLCCTLCLSLLSVIVAADGAPVPSAATLLFQSYAITFGKVRATAITPRR
jgi:hypothetical protein